MERIYKKINLEDFKSRSNEMLPSYYEGSTAYTMDKYTDWGRMPVDIKITGSTLSWWISGGTCLYPLVKNGSDTILRYRTMKDLYFWGKNFIKDSLYQKLCKREDENKWIKINLTEDEVFDRNIKFYSEEQGISGFSIGNIIGINEFADRYNNIFVINETSHTKDYFNFVDKVIKRGISKNTISIPYIDFNIEITKNEKAQGDFTGAINKWVAKKKYYLGDAVFYSGYSNEWKIYILSKGEDIDFQEMSGELYSYYLGMSGNTGYAFYSTIEEAKSHKSEIIQGNKKYFVATSDKILYSIGVYYTGYYNEETMTTSFDSAENAHWTSLESKESTEKLVTGESASNLSSMKRYTKSYDDSGNTLPFYYTQGEAKLEYVDPSGITNTYMSGEKVFGNMMKEINYYDKNNNKTTKENGETIEFIYYKDAEITSAYTIVNKTGIKYTEKHLYSYDDYTFIQDNKEISLKYVNIDLESPVGNKAGFANIEYYIYEKEKNEKEYSYFDENNLGIVDTKSEIDTDYDKGSYSARERHNALSEVKTMEDLENYKNGMFSIQD